MPKMSNVARVLSMISSDGWTTSFARTKEDAYKQFCIDNCPHKENPCNGTCKEIREWMKNNKRK